MMEFWATIITTLLGGSGVTAAGMQFWLNRKKQDYQQRIDEEKQATETLQKELERQSLRIDKLEAAHTKCMEGHIEEARKSGSLEGQIVQLSKRSLQQDEIIAKQDAKIASMKIEIEGLRKATPLDHRTQ